MYYAYRATIPSVILNHFHMLVINPIKGPKLRCIIPTSLNIQQPQVLLHAFACLKNYPDHSFTMKDLNELVLTQLRKHMSQSEQEEKDNNIFNYMTEHLCQGNVGEHLNEFFSKSIWNVDFEIGQEKENKITARISLKQLLEECCTEADVLGLEDGLIQLEDRLQSFLCHCSQTNAKVNTGSESLGISSWPCTPLSPRKGRTIPMTHGIYAGSANRVSIHITCRYHVLIISI
jgi:hypothetical protein